MRNNRLVRPSVSPVKFLLVATALLLPVLVARASTSSRIESVAAPSIARKGHTATALADGRVLIAGGENETGILASAELFDPQTLVFVPAGAMKAPRAGHTATRLADGRVLIAGGSQASAEIFDPATMLFRAIAGMTTVRRGHSATLMPDGKVLIAGGDEAGTLELFDPAAESFSAVTGTMSEARTLASATLFADASVLLAGGGTDSAEYFDSATLQCTLVPQRMTAARTGHTTIATEDGMLLLFGGDATGTVERFDPLSATFSLAGTLGASEVSATLLANEKILVLGEGLAGLFAGTLETLSDAGALQRRGHTATELPGDKRVLVAGGVNSSNEFVTIAALFNPAQIRTDQDDYPPLSFVDIFGTGFLPGETVNNQVVQIDGPMPGTVYEPWDVTADTNGEYATTWYVFTEDLLGTTLELTGRGLTSGLKAVTRFTDGTPQVDSVTPSPFSPNQASSTGANDTTTISAKNSGGGAISDFRVRVRAGSTSGAIVREFTFGSVAANGTVSTSWDGKNTGGSFVADGTYSVTALSVTGTTTNETTSPSGKVGSAVVDNTNPTVSLTSPADNTFVSGTIDLVAAPTDAGGDDSNIAKVEFYVDSGLVGTDTSSSSGWKASLNTTGLSNGDHTWFAKGFDKASNNVASVSRTIKKDSAAPSVAINAIANSCGTAAITITGTASDTPAGTGYGVASVQVTIRRASNNAVLASGSATGTSPWSFSYTPSEFSAQYAVATATDNAGNSTNSSQANFTVIATPTATVSGSASICHGGSATISAALTGTSPWTLFWSDGFSQTASASPATRSVSPSGMTTYTVTNVTASSCTGTSSGSATITVNATPSCLISGSTSVCPQASGLNYSAPAGLSYDWSITGNGSTSGPKNQQSVTVNASGLGSFTLALKVTDSNGCTNSCSQVVNVVDNQVPMITCPANITTNNDPGLCTANISAGAATATDDCSATVTGARSDGSPLTSPYPVGTTLITWSAFDKAGKTNTCTQTIIVNDTEAPTATCPAGTMTSADANCQAAIPNVIAGIVASDNCTPAGSFTITQSPTAGTMVGLGTHTITVTVKDAANNAGTCTTTFEVKDTTAPVITLTGGNLTLECHVDSFTEPGATVHDNCDANVSVTTGGSVNVNTPGTYVITYDATDAAGNPATQKTRTVMVKDTTKPTLTLSGANPMTVECHTSFTDPGATASDLCAGDLTGSIQVTGSVDANTVGSYTLTYSVSDPAGNKQTAPRTVNVVDTIAPTITLLGSSPVTVECHTSYTDAGATANDSCAGNLTASIQMTGSVNVNTPGNYTLHYNAADPSGNHAAEVTRSVMVKDTIAPVITLTGGDLMLECHVDSYVEPGAAASDSCDPSVSVVIGGSVNVNTPGTYVLTYDSMDATGNHATQKTRTVTVKDTIKPVISLAGSAELTLECHVDSYAEQGASVADACDTSLIAATVSGDTVNVNVPGTYAVTYNATDASGNHAVQVTRTVHVVDTTKPVIALNGNATMTLECHIDGYTEPGASVSDACDTSLTTATAGGDTVNVNVPGTYVVTYDAMDASGNHATQKTRTVHVVDTTKPVITLTGNSTLTLECHADSYTEAGATVFDACDTSLSTVTVGGDTVDVNTPGTYVVTYDAMDASGNAALEVTRTVHVVDTTKPVITRNGAASLTLECHGDNYTEAGAMASDLCDPAVLVVIGGDTVNVNMPGTYVVTYDATDVSGNHAVQVTRTVHVTDTIKPVVSLNGGNMTLECHVDSYVEPGATASDVCDPSVPVVIGGSVDVNTPGTYVVTYDAMDASGNHAVQKTRTVTVKDTTKPTLTLLGATPMTVECHTSFADPGATASDACAGSLTSAIHITGSVDANTVGTYTLTYSVSDGFNTETATRTINVVDTIAPTLTLIGANPMTVECHTGFADPGATASDSCAGSLTSAIQVSGSVDANTVGSYTLTYSVSDGHNTSTQMRTVKVVDTTKPVITLNGGSLTLQCHMDSYTEPGATVSDTCDVSVSVVIGGDTVNPNAVGTYIVTYNATDASGNHATQKMRTVRVVDTLAPSANCPANIIVPCSINPPSPVAYAATATDACDPTPTAVFSPASGSVFAFGTTTINCTVTDHSGNSSSCNFTVTQQALGFNGFLAPISGADATGGSYVDPVRTFKTGSTIPVKFAASCGNAAVITGVHKLQAIKWGSPTTSDAAVDATPQDAATTGNQFRLTDSQWHFNLDTKGTGMSKGVWQLIATLSDGSKHSVFIQLK